MSLVEKFFVAVLIVMLISLMAAGTYLGVV